MKTTIQLAASALLLGASLLAQDQPKPVPPAPKELLGQATRNLQPRTVGPNTSTFETEVVMEGASITIQPSQWFALPQSKLDFSDATHASIAIQNAYNDITGLRIAAAWAGSGGWFNFTDISPRGSFPVLDHGSLYTPVYASTLKVLLYNESAVPIEVKQVTVNVTK
jgi:hypothetical protein